MRENRPYGLEGGESGSTGLPYPYRKTGGPGDRLLRGMRRIVAIRCQAVVGVRGRLPPSGDRWLRKTGGPGEGRIGPIGYNPQDRPSPLSPFGVWYQRCDRKNFAFG
jgi:hypothetical protein